MADGALNIRFGDDTVALLESEAKALGMAPEALAAEMLGRLLHDPQGRDLPATGPEDYNGPFVDLDDAPDARVANSDVTLKLDDYAATKLAAKAEALGVSVEDLATSLVSSQLFDYDDFTWSNGDPRNDHADNYDLNEQGRLWSDVRPELIARLNRKLAERG